MKMKQNRNLALVATIAIQLCVGVAYIWSVFQSGIATSLFAGNNTSASYTYSILLAVLGFGSIIGGKLVPKITIKYVVMIGGFLMSLGFFLASLTTPEFPQALWLTYGIIGGISMGFVYSPTIACVQKCFPEKKGLVTGLVVAALGLGGVVFTPVVEAIIAANGGVGVGELVAIRVISIVFLVICTVGSLFLYTPEQKTTTTSGEISNDLTATQVIKTSEFYLIAFAMMLACIGGLMMIGFAKPIAEGRGMGEAASVGVLMISIANAAGRLSFGAISDKIGRINTLLILMIGSSILPLMINFAQGYLIFVLIGFIGFFYGGLLSTFPSLTAETFGAKNSATIYGMVLVGFGIAALVSSNLGGYYKNIAANNIDKMFPAFAIASACSLVAVFLILVLSKKQKTKKLSA